MSNDSDFKSRFLEDVKNWLDSLEAPIPPDIPGETEVSGHPPSLFDLLAQMTALTQEVKLANRATNRLNSEVTAGITKLSEASANPSPAALSKARREGRLEAIQELLDVRDRFERGILEAERRMARKPGFFERLARNRNREVLEGIVSGNRLALDRLDDTLRRMEVLGISAGPGDHFDPALMKCVETVIQAGVPPHKVLDVLRPGFTHQGRVLRYAEVKVSREEGNK